MDISHRISIVKEKIRIAAEKKGRSPKEVRLVVVSKTFGANLVREAMEYGATVFGESRVQEAREKIGVLGRQNLEWHLIGHLQHNKVKYIFDLFDYVHSVDSVELAREIHRRGASGEQTMKILIQVNIAGDRAKHGITPEKTQEIIKEISLCKNLSIQGLMTIPPYHEDPEESRPHYAALRELRDRIATEGFQLRELSMGMSNDYEVAVEEGATMVRVGSAIFGGRTYV